MTSCLKRSLPQAEYQEHQRAWSQVMLFWPGLLVALAWAVLFLASWTHQTYLINHDYLLQESGLPWLAALLFFLGCWQVMTVATMGPSSMLAAFRLQQRDRPAGTTVAFLIAYLAIWTVFALLAFVGDTLIHQMVRESSWLSHHVWVIGAGTLSLAGCFEFTPSKARALSKCGNAVGMPKAASHIGQKQGWSVGCSYGGWCLRSCWALMLVQFGIGAGSIMVMAAMALLIALEKHFPSSRWLRWGAGTLLLLFAVGWAVDPAGMLRTIGG